LRTAAVAVIVAWMTAQARADGAVMVVGKVTPRDRDVIVDAIRGVGTALSLRFSAAPGRDAADASACLRDQAPWSCVAAMVRGKDQLVIVEVDSDHGAGAPITIVTAHLLIAGAEDESFASRNCAMCNEDALKRTVGDLSRDLLQRAVARAGRTRLAIRSVPDRAQLVVDGAPAGATDTTLATYPGRHVVEVSVPGYAPASRDVVAIAGATVEIEIALARDARPTAVVVAPAEHPADGGSRWLAKLAVATGGAAIVTGGLLYALSPRGDVEHRYFYSTRPPGVVSMIAGAAVALPGLYFWLRGRF
jgi:hypothetical protein